MSTNDIEITLNHELFPVKGTILVARRIFRNTPLYTKRPVRISGKNPDRSPSGPGEYKVQYAETPKDAQRLTRLLRESFPMDNQGGLHVKIGDIVILEPRKNGLRKCSIVSQVEWNNQYFLGTDGDYYKKPLDISWNVKTLHFDELFGTSRRRAAHISIERRGVFNVVLLCTQGRHGSATTEQDFAREYVPHNKAGETPSPKPSF